MAAAAGREMSPLPDEQSLRGYTIHGLCVQGLHCLVLTQRRVITRLDI